MTAHVLNPFTSRANSLCWAIEKLPASEQQTMLSVEASALRTAVNDYFDALALRAALNDYSEPSGSAADPGRVDRHPLVVDLIRAGQIEATAGNEWTAAGIHQATAAVREYLGPVQHGANMKKIGADPKARERYNCIIESMAEFGPVEGWEQYRVAAMIAEGLS